MYPRKTSLSRDQWQAVADDLVAANDLLVQAYRRLSHALARPHTAKLCTAIRRLDAARGELKELSSARLRESTLDWFYRGDLTSV
jgi:hypothetical protein